MKDNMQNQIFITNKNYQYPFFMLLLLKLANGGVLKNLEMKHCVITDIPKHTPIWDSYTIKRKIFGIVPVEFHQTTFFGVPIQGAFIRYNIFTSDKSSSKNKKNK
jgi:hypothetical protein